MRRYIQLTLSNGEKEFFPRLAIEKLLIIKLLQRKELFIKK